jgi:peptide/nickel transport system permease protein
VHLYAKETVERPGVGTVREYPRLRFGGAGLADPAHDRARDIARRVTGALGAAVIVLAALVGLSALWLAQRRGIGFSAALEAIAHGNDRLPWRTALAVLGSLAAIVLLGLGLATAYHVFGTDKVGGDVLYSTLKSVRTGLVIGTLTTLVMLPFAIALGMIAGYFRGLADDVIQYLYTTLNSIPGVLLIAAAVLLMQGYIERNPEMFDTSAARADFRLLFLCMILGVTSWTGLCRLLRGETLKLRELEYVEAARAFGVSSVRIMTRHLLPNLGHIVLINVVIDFSGLVLAEAVLSYVGVGVDPTMQSFGNMINSARLEMAREPVVWWQLAAAFIFMFALVLAANLFADAVRDAFDPRQAARRG